MAIARTLLGGLTKATTRGGITEEQAQNLMAALEKKGVKNPIHTGYLPEQGGLGNAIRKDLGYSQQDIEPRGVGERYAQNLIGAGIPALFGGKAAARQAVPSIAAGQAAATGLESVGAPDWLQKVGTLAGEALGSHGGRRLKEARAAKELGHKHEPTKEHGEHLYTTALSNLKKNEKGTGEAIKPFLSKIPGLWKKNSDEKAVKRAEKIANTISANIDHKGNIDIEAAHENIKSLGKQYADATPGERVYIEEARKGLKQVLKDHSVVNPLFGKALEDANAFHVYRKTDNIMKQYIDKPGFIGKKLPFIARGLNALESVGRAALNGPARNYYKKLAEAVFDERKGDIRRYAIAFNNAYEKQLEKEEEGFEEVPLEEGFEEVVSTGTKPWESQMYNPRV